MLLLFASVIHAGDKTPCSEEEDSECVKTQKPTGMAEQGRNFGGPNQVENQIEDDAQSVNALIDRRILEPWFDWKSSLAATGWVINTILVWSMRPWNDGYTRDIRMRQGGNHKNYQADSVTLYFDWPAGYLCFNPGTFPPVNGEHFEDCPNRHAAK